MKAYANETATALMNKGNNRAVITAALKAVLNEDGITLAAFAGITQLDPDTMMKAIDTEAQKYGSTLVQFMEKLEGDI